MAVLKPRERLVYFRISEDEFRQFLTVCEQAGARSVSDLARNAVQRLINEGNRQRDDEALTARMHRLEKLIAEVTEQLHLLNGHRNGDTHRDDLDLKDEACSSEATSEQNKRDE